MTTSNQGNAALLEAMMNLTRFHREHEKFYASSPREFAVTLQRHARTLLALADQWSTTEASTRAVLSPYEGAEDLNSSAARRSAVPRGGGSTGRDQPPNPRPAQRR